MFPGELVVNPLLGWVGHRRHKGEADLLKWLCFKHMGGELKSHRSSSLHPHSSSPLPFSPVCCAPGHYGPNCERK